jgi:hypothetical protein
MASSIEGISKFVFREDTDFQKWEMKPYQGLCLTAKYRKREKIIS